MRTNIESSWLRVVRKLRATVATPFYVFNSEAMRCNVEQFESAFELGGRPVSFFYSLKTNPAVAVASIVGRAGWGFLASSARDLRLAKKVGAATVIFDAPIKTSGELNATAGHQGAIIACENLTDLQKTINRLNRNEAPLIGLRIMLPPAVAGCTSRFGFDLRAIKAAFAVLRKAEQKVYSLHFHLGHVAATPGLFYLLADFAAKAWTIFGDAGYRVAAIDVGGSIPGSLCRRALRTYARAVQTGLSGKIPENVRVLVEPGRAIVENSAIFCVQVKDISIRNRKTFILVDGGSNSLIPHSINPTGRRIERFPGKFGETLGGRATVVGPLCAESDVLGIMENSIGIRIGDLLIVKDVGAYDWSTRYEFGVLKPKAYITDGRCLHRFA